MIGDVFTRWAVVTKHDGAPTEGCVYTHKDKAIKRMRAMATPEKFDVRRIVVMSEETLAAVIEKLAKARP